MWLGGRDGFVNESLETSEVLLSGMIRGALVLAVIVALISTARRFRRRILAGRPVVAPGADGA